MHTQPRGTDIWGMITDRSRGDVRTVQAGAKLSDEDVRQVSGKLQEAASKGDLADVKHLIENMASLQVSAHLPLAPFFVSYFCTVQLAHFVEV